MINSIIAGIASGIIKKFGKNTVIYSEDVKQGLSLPCFFIKNLNSEKKQGLGDRMKFINSFVIQYFPKTNRKSEDMNVISDKLFDCLEFISAGEKVIRGTDMHTEKSSGVILNGHSTAYENSNGVLNFYVNYNFHARRDDDVFLMTTLTEKRRI